MPLSQKSETQNSALMISTDYRQNTCQRSAFHPRMQGHKCEADNLNKQDILLTFDVEDWFQVENFKAWIPFSTWSSYELRVEKNTHLLLDLLDDGPGTPRATFFILGWIAKRLPNLVLEIHDRGHEVASHGYNHNLSNKQPIEELKKDLTDSKKLLEDIIGFSVSGYRAPSFAIDRNVLKAIKECKYLYDSSFNSFGMHGRYGKVDLSGSCKKGVALEVSNNFFELPVSNIELKKFILPLGGGGYFRIIPFQLFRLGIQAVLKKENAYVFYLHPWEIDPMQPRMHNAKKLYKFRHYVNLKKTYNKLSTLLNNFQQCRFSTCHEYLNSVMELGTNG